MTPPADEASIDAALLAGLLPGSAPVTMDSLARMAGVAEPGLRRSFDRLAAAGCELEFHPQRGVRLVRSGLECWADFLEHGWRNAAAAAGPHRRLVRVYRKTASTQDVARQLLRGRGGEADGAVIVADEQTAGRGRLGRKWIASPGSAVMFSLVHVSKAATADRLMLASAVGVAGAVASLLGAAAGDVRIKWPNDVLIGGKKVAGILVEMTSGTPGGVIGVGINVGRGIESLHDVPEELRSRVTSLATAGYAADRLLVLAEAVRSIDRALAAGTADLLHAWRARSTLLLQRVTLQTAGGTVRGEVVDLDASDGLVVRTDTGAIVHLPAATTTILPG